MQHTHSSIGVAIMQGSPVFTWIITEHRSIQFLSLKHIFLIYKTSLHGTLRPANLILINRFPLPLLFHNHCSLPVPIRGYQLPTPLLYLGFLTLLSIIHATSPSSLSSSPPSCPYHSPLPLLPSPTFPFLPWERRRLSRLFAWISWFAKQNSLLFIRHFLRHITATA